MSSLLERRAQLAQASSLTFSSAQQEINQLLNGFTEGAADPYTFAAMMAGSLVYRFVRVSSLPVFTRLFGNSQPLLASLGSRVFSTSLAFTSEVFAFEGSHRVLRAKFAGLDSAFLRWSGEQGLKKGFLYSALNLGALKLAGVSGVGQNVVLQHLFADTAVVASQQLASFIGISAASTESLVQQYAFAEVMQVQMKVGMSLLHQTLPQLGQLEQKTNLEIGIREKNIGNTFGIRGQPVTEVFASPNVVVESGSGIKVGDLIEGRFRVERLLGKGGMGLVYGIRHVLIDKPMAIKVLRPGLSSQAETVERFRREAIAASKIGNDHIVDVVDLGQLADGTTYYIMEYLDGVSLGKAMEGKKPLAHFRVLSIARQIALGLEAAHAQGIIHRDLKPDNIFLLNRDSRPDFVKILDFGIAKFLDGRKGLTQVGVVFGTPEYMSPEQVSGKALDHRSDIYALGVILYEMTTGRIPFEGNEAAVIMRKHLSVDPAPFREMNLPTQIPPSFERIVFKCLAKEAAQRYQTMRELLEDLTRYEREMRGLPISPTLMLTEGERPPSFNPDTFVFPRIYPRWLFYAGGGGLGLLLLGAFFATRKTESAKVPPVSIAPPSSALITETEVPQVTPLKKKRRVEVSIEPFAAHFFKGGEDLGSRSVMVEVAENENVILEARCDGYRSKKIKLDASQAKISVVLERLPKIKAAKLKPVTPEVPTAAPLTPKRSGGLVNPWMDKKE